MQSLSYSQTARSRTTKALKAFSQIGADPNNLESWPAYMDQDAASAFLELVCGVRFAPKSLQKRRVVGGSPPFQKFGNRVTYPRDLLKTWGDAQRGPVIQTTSEISTA